MPDDRSRVAPWVRQLTEEVIGGSPLEIGKRYIHPEDGLIEIVGGQYWGTNGLSNHWRWRVIATGETHHGYGDSTWPKFPDISTQLRQDIIDELRKMRPSLTQEQIDFFMAEHDRILEEFVRKIQASKEETDGRP
jgi:hypothetical protein